MPLDLAQPHIMLLAKIQFIVGPSMSSPGRALFR